MTSFTDLYHALDGTTRTSEKRALLTDYFREAPPEDAAWAVFYLSGQRLKGLVRSGLLRQWAAEVADVPDWLFDEAYNAVGDLAETIALLLPDAEAHAQLPPLHRLIDEWVAPLRTATDDERRQRVAAAWGALPADARFVYNKLLRGGFRVGVSKRTVTAAVAEAAGLDTAVVALRLMGDWKPSAEAFQRLIAPDEGEADTARPYPFFLAHPLEGPPDELGPVTDWLAEEKWDGVRAQIVRRDGQTFLWSRGEDEVAFRFPEIADAAHALPDGTVLDGEIVGWRDGRLLPFTELQRRLNRVSVSARLLSDVPVRLFAFDVLERDGSDLRQRPLAERRRALHALLPDDGLGPIVPAPTVPAGSWEALAEHRATSRDRGVEGLMLKRRTSPYRVGRPRGDWWKWKVEPLTFDAVLVYARPGTGRRASLFTDLSFAVWRGDELVKIADAYSGLTDAEFRELSRFVRRNTTERFGPVRAVTPTRVFELACEGVNPSKRHKAGVAVRFPRIVRARPDKTPQQADSLDTVRALAGLDSDTT
ncbi:MAG: ATP-dependent DNA ligase [Rubricoccaceae bacterium]|nr:ATP-dependent DNA ligase [Rubricoccaceae bacterium]